MISPDSKSGELRPDLPDITLVAITSVAVQPTIDALHKSMHQARFGQVLFLSDQPLPVGADPQIELRPIERLRSRSDYSRFMLRELAAHIATPHALCIQWDGFVLDGARWNPAFLDYDYIGALWPHFRDGHNVGNGGFSLRSRCLLAACASLPFDGTAAEDIVISRLCRPLLEGQGMHFAPESLAREFAYERTKATGREFGFHGAFNLMRYLSAEESVQLFRELEPSVLAKSERRELLLWALARGHPTLVLALLRRLLARADLSTTPH